ncbi:ABC transporter ATP-binding protein [Pyrococcus furiosus DSM 3638]|uniref:ABC transporter n=3 Tax=Pyrococcus furiosus TaxID=2261 RepID=Q8U418_PYRFU|nr:ABC transporter ATP-binding protein [Pyrococcus furiosus]AAL80403.1 putative ABC transporter [Pyrococcus furiosus DSM 3638]AFN03066.1 ABC transporter [Pyrococcus furiosus COM1]QEK77996.1 ABC transporter ATP-binding protein [Pyrococcus furiosus DSM 3638]
MEYVIETKDLTKFFGKRNIVYHLNLKVPKGVVYGFLGPNGAGKTTTIKMLTGALRPTYGEIKIFGLDMPQKRVDIMKKVGYMPEVPIAYEDMTIFEFLIYMGRLSGLKKEEAREQAKMLMKYVGVGRVALNKIKELSSGQKQRVSFASALIGNPELLILDEPTANLDPLGRIEFIGKIISLAKEGKTIFVSSHIVSEVEKMCNYVGLINQGRLIAQGKISELTRIEEDEYDISTSDNKAAIEYLKEKPYVREVWEEEHIIRVRVDPRFLDEFFLQFPRYLTSQGIRLKLFKPHTSPLERILMEKFSIGEESD